MTGYGKGIITKKSRIAKRSKNCEDNPAWDEIKVLKESEEFKDYEQLKNEEEHWERSTLRACEEKHGDVVTKLLKEIKDSEERKYCDDIEDRVQEALQREKQEEM